MLDHEVVEPSCVVVRGNAGHVCLGPLQDSCLDVVLNLLVTSVVGQVINHSHMVNIVVPLTVELVLFNSYHQLLAWPFDIEAFPFICSLLFWG